jgi:hypothetical protein
MLPDRAGLAVIEGKRILTFGDATAREELLRVSSAPEAQLEHVVIRAHPTTGLTDAPGPLLVRPAFSYSFEW